MRSFSLKQFLTATILLATCHCDLLTPFRHEEVHHSRYVNRSPFDDVDAVNIAEASFIWSSVRNPCSTVCYCGVPL